MYHVDTQRKFPVGVKNFKGIMRMWVKNPDYERTAFAIAREPDGPFCPPCTPPDLTEDGTDDISMIDHVRFGHCGYRRNCEVCI